MTEQGARGANAGDFVNLLEKHRTQESAAKRRKEPVSGFLVLTDIEIFRMEEVMGKSDDLRKNAENCTELADAADFVQKKQRYERMARSWSHLAETQSWLDGESTKNPNKVAE